MADIVELRIHGVGGGTAQQLLGDDVVPIGDAADDLAGFWEDPTPAGGPPRTRQIYSWGGFSGRNFTRAFWLLLLPFSVINMAGWMVDPAAGPRLTALQRGLVRLIASAETVLLMTWLGAIAFDAFDTSPLGIRLAWSSGAMLAVLVVIAIASKRSARYEDFGTLPSEEADAVAAADDDLGLGDPEFWRTAPVIEALRHSEFAVAAATVAFLPAVSLWRLTDAPVPMALAVASILLASTALAVAIARTTGPTAAMLGAAGWLLAGAGMLTALTTDLPAPGTDLDGLWAAAPLWVLAVAGVLVVLLAAVECLAWVRRHGDAVISAGGWTIASRRGAMLIIATGVALVVVSNVDGDGPGLWWMLAAVTVVAVGYPAGVALTTRRRFDGVTFLLLAVAGMGLLLVHRADGELTAIGWFPVAIGVAAVAYPAVVTALISRGTFDGVICGILVVVAGLLAAGANGLWWLGVGFGTGLFAVTAFAETGRRDRFRWLPVTTVSTLSLLLLAATYAGLSRIGHAWLGPATELPTGHGWITAMFAAVVLAVGSGAIVYLLHRRHEVWPWERVVSEYPDAPEPCRSTMTAAAGRRRAVSDLTFSIDVVITLITGMTGLALLALLGRADRPAMDLWSLDRIHLALTASPWPRSWSWLATGGAVVGAAFPVLAIAALALSIRYGAIRRKVGVVWDVGTFWPRRFHPLAPPAYAERAVPELATHVANLTVHRGVVVAGYSQGSVLGLAAAMQLGEADPHRLALLAYGSPLGRYYRRFWPAVFGDGICAGLAGSWRAGGGGEERFCNAYRLSDPIAGAVFTGPDEQIGVTDTDLDTDLRLPDPRWPGTTAGCPRPMGHFRYEADPEVAAALDVLGATTQPR
ncbi:MAG: hypothetical protein H0V96_10165 [Acidimicrobiia bacterium]|nr:hypothetical protein [Acidimicrobiia bacterium]